MQDLLADNASPDIDYVSVHSWPDNWGKVDEAFQREFIQSRITAAAGLGKPMLLEEWGKWVNESADATLADRSAFMGIVYEEVEAAMADPASPLQGSAFWQARPSFS